MKKRLYLLLPVLAAAVALVVFLVGGRNAAESAEPAVPEKLLYCGTCHSMEQEVTTWTESPHSSVSCLQCHEESDVAWVKHNLDDLGPDMAESTPRQALHTLPLKAPERRCKDCHASQMDDIMKDVTPKPILGSTKPKAAVGSPMPIDAAHAVHTEKVGLSCNDCHTNSAHGMATTAAAKRDQSHEQCMSCHTEKKVTLAVTSSTSCSACHTDAAAVTPDDHKNETAWLQAHGKAASQQACGECHLSESAGPKGPLANPTMFPSTTGDSCAACHSGVPMPHPDGFMAQHGKAALQAKSGTCDACHSPVKSPVQPAPAHARAGFCTDCHLQTMPHTTTFVSQHGQAAWKAPATCEACHTSKNPARPTAAHASKSYCTSCHDSYQHEGGWVASHGTQVDKSCAACHNTAGQQQPSQSSGLTIQHNACSACHNANGKWHPDMFFVTHGKQVQTEGKEACMTCHNEVEPSCAKCHREY